MAYVITEPCIGVKDRACVEVCPMDCIQEGRLEQGGKTYEQLFINPEECIDCGLCEPVCPVSAIYMDIDVPQRWSHFIDLNARFYKDR